MLGCTEQIVPNFLYGISTKTVASIVLESRPDSPRSSSQYLPCMPSLIKMKWNPRCHLVAGEFSIRWQHLICFIMYIVQLYKEDRAILHMLGYWTCSPEQQFQLSSANTTQMIGKF